MSYCRWSDLDYQCDVYAYETEGGYQIHVAKNKRIFNEPMPPKVYINFVGDQDEVDAWVKRHEAVMGIVERSELVDIGLPYDGESYCFDSLIDFYACLVMLRDAGYRIPDWTMEEAYFELGASGELDDVNL